MDMHVTTKSLEDIFLELTDSEKKPGKKPEKQAAGKKLRLGRKKKKRQKRKNQKKRRRVRTMTAIYKEN